MSTTTLADRAERTTAELAEAGRAYLEEAEQHAARAAEAAARAAEHYGERASRAAHEAADSIGETYVALRADVEELLDDPETRRTVTYAAGGLAVAGVVLWAWRRRRRRKQDRYESTLQATAGWDDPSALETTQAG